jgi:hypothetical protein
MLTTLDPENIGDIILRNVGSYTDYTTLYPRRINFSSLIFVLERESMFPVTYQIDLQILFKLIPSHEVRESLPKSIDFFISRLFTFF